MDHPRIKPWLQPVTRRKGELQFGVAVGGVIVEGLSRDEAHLLARLDGSMSRHGSFDEAGRLGIAASRWRELLDLVEGCDLLEFADPRPGSPSDASARLPGHVLVDGTGDLARECSMLLRRCGVGRVTHGRTAVDVALGSPQLSRADVVVLMANDALDPRRGDPWLTRGTPHLPVVIAGPHAQVGPVVGAWPGSPCLWCLDLHRADRDEDWPAVLAQLCGAYEPTLTTPLPPAEGPAELTHLVAGVVALLAMSVLRGGPTPPGVSVEVSLPWPRMDHRRWSPHPRCGRHRPVASGVA